MGEEHFPTSKESFIRECAEVFRGKKTGCVVDTWTEFCKIAWHRFRAAELSKVKL
jgi:hypothetical protein